ncbi:phosphatidate cytidylyltransferase [Chelativorans intermedius]|uniref:Phosphatidate cytidylyltransferase n=1 Tax=Chelativorans intermedius TaxID=515947 RepID=A0ABV6D328_9HYPH
MSGRDAAGRSELTRRLASALVLGVAALVLTVLGGVAFRFFAVLAAVLVFHEWMAMRAPEGRAQALVAWGLLGAGLLALLAGSPAAAVFALLAAGCLLALLHAALAGGSAWPAAGIAYAGLPALALAFLRGAHMAGLIAILYLFAVVWATDIGAYFAGRALGGPKLAPSISPGKTWSGAAGGALSAVAAGAAVAWFSPAGLAPGPAGLLALLLSAVSQAGDLFESALKRRHGVKDSGSLIPGHGGVMDRVDGLVAAAVLLYALGALSSGLETPAAGFFSR